MYLENESSTANGIPHTLQAILALCLIVLLGPLMLLVAIAIRLESPGPALYSQIRVGEYGRRFRLYKFRSMRIPTDSAWVDPLTLQSDREGVCRKLFRDPRITRIGRVIRKLSIDELPQLFNVLRGDMALIGPRPALPEEVDAYDERACGRLDARPGLTGLWQVSGRADTTFDEQVQLDVEYVRSRSLFLDIRILFATVPAVLSGAGAY